MATPTQTQAPANGALPPAAPAIYVPPRSPEEVAREQQRLNILFEINALLLQHGSQLQGEGLGGWTSSVPKGVDPSTLPKASQEYMICMRCMQANITWIAASAQGVAGNPRSTAGPAIMDSPIESPGLQEKYEELRRLFPGWRGTLNMRATGQGGTHSQNQQPQMQPLGQGQGQGQPQPQMMQQGQSGPAPGVGFNMPSG